MSDCRLPSYYCKSAPNKPQTSLHRQFTVSSESPSTNMAPLTVHKTGTGAVYASILSKDNTVELAKQGTLRVWNLPWMMLFVDRLLLEFKSYIIYCQAIFNTCVNLPCLKLFTLSELVIAKLYHFAPYIYFVPVQMHEIALIDMIITISHHQNCCAKCVMACNLLTSPFFPIDCKQ